MGTHLRVLSESFPMNTNMTGLDGFRKSLRSCALDERSLSIERVEIATIGLLLSLKCLVYTIKAKEL